MRKYENDSSISDIIEKHIISVFNMSMSWIIIKLLLSSDKDWKGVI